MAHKKVNLPTKVCPVCQRPFAWRKKWKKVWNEVKYCSDRCRTVKTQPVKPASFLCQQSDIETAL